MVMVSINARLLQELATALAKTAAEQPTKELL
jgi:hypothetical protein